jgi:hypothetical protein
MEPEHRILEYQGIVSCFVVFLLKIKDKEQPNKEDSTDTGNTDA